MKVGEFLAKHNLLPPQTAHDADVLEDILPTEAEDVIDQFLGTVDSKTKEKNKAFLGKHIISQSQSSEGQPPLKKMRTRQSANIHKRVKALETHTKQETHVCDIPINITSLATNDIFSNNIFESILPGTGENQRVGNEVRIKSIEVTFQPEAQPALDVYLVRPDSGTVIPITGHFSGTQGGRYKDNEGWEIKHWLLGGSNSNSFYSIDDRVSFKYPMKVKYDGNFVRLNTVYFAVTNHTGATVNNLNGNIRVRFYA